MYTILDFETTGLNYMDNQVVEIGAVKLDKYMKPVSQLNLLVKLDEGRELPDFITNLTGITAEDLENGIEDEYTALSMLEAFIGDDIVVAQFASFDLSYLSKVMKPERFICTRSVSRILDPNEKASLKNLVPRYGTDNKDAHRAFADVEATVEVFKSMMGRVALEGYSIHNIMNLIIDSNERPLNYVPQNANITFMEV